jgi:HK97 family phage major capsid protein
VEPDEIKKLTENVEQAVAGVQALKADQEKSVKELGEKVKGLESLPATIQELKDNQSRLQAAFERPGVGENDDKKEAGEQSKIFVKGLKQGSTALTHDDVALLHKGMSTDDLPNGGFMVPVGTMGVINGQIFETSPMRRIAKVQTTSFKSVEFDLDDDEAEASWDGEGPATVTNTGTPETGKIEIVARKIVAEPSVTDEILQDSAWDIESWLSGKVADKFSRTENRSFVVGNSKLQPKGFLTYPNWNAAGVYQRNAIEQLINGSTTAPVIEALIDLQGSLKEPYQQRATWVMKRSTLVAIKKLKGSEHFHLLNLQPTYGPQGTVMGEELLGKPVVLMDDMPAIANGSLSIGYGDFSRGYQILDRVGITVLRDNLTTKGKVKYYTTKRVGGAVINFEAIKLLKFVTN